MSQWSLSNLSGVLRKPEDLFPGEDERVIHKAGSSAIGPRPMHETRGGLEAVGSPVY